MKKCTDCEVLKESNDFYQRGNSSRGVMKYSSSCRMCTYAKTRLYKQSHPEVYKIRYCGDSTWDRKNKIHTCCGSKSGWRHLVSCKNVISGEDDYGDLSDLTSNK